MKSLHKKNVLVTGASGGIGNAIVNAFTKCGANVYAWGHKACAETQFEYSYQIVELENIDDIMSQFEKLPEKIDVLVNCAGYTCGCVSEDYPYELWEKTLKINLTAPFILSQLVAKRMINNGGGSIINITSIGAELGFPNNPAYGASKGGLKQLTKALACDWAKYGIRVNSIGPGYTKTNMTAVSYSDVEKRRERTSRILLERWAEPEDIVGTVMYLASDMSKYVTGQDIYVDGGWTIKGM